nr:zinc finger, CCHC-type [Tanacetum cinerariifolium]
MEYMFKSVFSLRWNCKELRKIMKLRVIIMKTGVPGQEGAEGNDAESDAVACEVISKWIFVMEEYMDTRYSMRMLSNDFRQSSDDNNIYYWKFSNEMLVQILLGGHSTLSLEGGLLGNRDEEKKSGPQFEVPTLVEAVAYRRRLTIITKVEIVRILVCNS